MQGPQVLESLSPSVYHLFQATYLEVIFSSHASIYSPHNIYKTSVQNSLWFPSPKPLFPVGYDFLFDNQSYSQDRF